MVHDPVNRSQYTQQSQTLLASRAAFLGADCRLHMQKRVAVTLSSSPVFRNHLPRTRVSMRREHAKHSDSLSMRYMHGKARRIPLGLRTHTSQRGIRRRSQPVVISKTGLDKTLRRVDCATRAGVSEDCRTRCGGCAAARNCRFISPTIRACRL
ncbi:hypothetical protein HYPSUDRAFT_34505 [Hypholoma sublateritium FD-334 SS-4]|uniref:Uncharacterized protein n=1 Tax=Hypholoma sublateritium (strain FD-334 SS-4) TaxID=945553 RepID=A0A0D2LKC3_HYPSF|nr:hypothetical protein HYPSUDRAFT_34505 [Hypholoma sublateritium FD-334 SS-4]